MWQQSALQRTAFVSLDGAGVVFFFFFFLGELREIWLHYRKTAESGLVRWERGEKGMAQLDGKVQTDLLWLPKSSAVPKDSQTDWTVNNPHCCANLTNTDKSSDFVNGLWYLMSAQEWKWYETSGLWENLILQSPLKSWMVFFLQNCPMRVYFHLVLNSCTLCGPQVSSFTLLVKFVGVCED